MKLNKKDAWERIEKIISETGARSVNSFARKIGLLRGENLYQIKRGNNGISIETAEKINTEYPQCSVSWIMFGTPEFDSPEIINVPLYRELSYQKSQESFGEKSLIFSKSLFGRCDFAVRAPDDRFSPIVSKGDILLFKKTLTVLEFRLYYIETELYRWFAQVHPHEDKDHFKLKISFHIEPDYYIYVRKDAILSISIHKATINFQDHEF